jgi:hypothetical protein
MFTPPADFDALVDEFTGYYEAVVNDKAFNRLGHAFERLNDDFVELQEDGLAALKSEGKGLARDFWNVIVPRAIGLIKEVRSCPCTDCSGVELSADPLAACRIPQRRL